jgi:hypothetical protein
MEMGQIGASPPTMATNRVCVTKPSSNPAFVRVRNSYYSKTHLSCWPAFPIILSYSVGEGLPISDEYNVFSALEHSNHIGTLDLTVTTTQSKQDGQDHAEVIVSSSGVSGACDG